MREKLIFFVSACLVSVLTIAQPTWGTYDFASPVTIDFNTTVSGANNGAYDGSGLASAPSAGELDADAWEILGLSDGDLTFGTDGTTGDYARGLSAGGVTTGGMYSFDVATGDYTLGFQPTSTDADPSVTLRVANDQACAIRSINFDVDLWLYNDQTGGSSSNADITLSYSEDNSSFTTLGTIQTDDGTASTWTESNLTGDINGLNIANTEYFYLKVSCTELVTGGDDRDEFAVGDIVLKINTGPTDVSTPAITENSLGGAVSFSGGSGDGRVLFLNSANSFTDAVDATDYSGGASSYFTNDGEQTLFAGTGTSFDITGLKQGTTYYYRVWEYYDCAGTEYYNLGTEGSGTIDTDLGACLKEGFDDLATALPVGWSFSNVVAGDIEVTNFGNAAPSLVIDNVSDRIITPQVNFNVEGLSFWLFISGDPYLGNFGVQGSSNGGSSWTTIKQFGSGEIKTGEGYNYYLAGDDVNAYNQFRFRFVSGGALPTNMFIDDIKLVCADAATGGTYTVTSNGTLDFQDEGIYTPNRTVFGAEDSIVFNGGGTVTLNNFPDQALGRLSVKNGTTVNLVPESNNTDLFLLGGDYQPLFVNEASRIEISNNKTFRFLIANDESVEIDGVLSFEGSVTNQILPLNSSSVEFNKGASFYNSSDHFPSGYSSLRPFGNFNYVTGQTSFKLGANYYHDAANLEEPFTSSEDEIVSFLSGSNYFFQPGAVEDPGMDGKTFGNFIYNQSQTATATVSVVAGTTMDTLKLLDGSFNIQGSFFAPINILGDIDLNTSGSLGFLGDSGDESDINFTGTVTQNVTGTSGDLTLASDAHLKVGVGKTLNISHGTYCEGPATFGGTINLTAGDSLMIDGALTNSGTFNIADDAALIQTDGSTLDNTGGTFNVTRNIPDGNSSNLFYMWSNPVAAAEAQIGPTGELNGSPRYYFTQGENQQSDYVAITSDQNMNVGEGYAVYGQSTATFSGTVNNGDVTYTNGNHISGEESYTLVGNPYPSAINAASFLAENSTNLDGAVYLFSHLADSTYNSEKQFIAVNSLGTSDFHSRFQTTASTHIASCQGFMVQAESSISAGSYNIEFTNAMRTGSNAEFKSGGFNIHDKYWITVSRLGSNQEASMLVAHLDEASIKYDDGLDAKMFSSSLSIGAVGEFNRLSILALPEIEKTDIIPLHLRIPTTGTYELASLLDSEVANAFSGFVPYILDAQLGVHVPMGDSYSFSATPGTIDDRFFIVYLRSSTPTGISDYTKDTAIEFRVQNDGILIVGAHLQSEVQLMNLAGQVLANYAIESEIVKIPKPASGLYLVKVSSGSGQRVETVNRLMVP